jgi:anthranilate phosphoribosyltransferase
VAETIISPAQVVQPDPAAVMRSIIKRIATGPELSKDISRDEARAGMRFVLDGQVDPVQAGIFLIALRMKRETDDENLGILDALREAAHIVTAAVDEVVDVADPYDGFNRTLPASPFLPVVLAACGIPAVSHGVERMGPKYGVTHRQVLRAAGVPVNLGPEQAAARLGEPDIGWVYVDQEAFCPKLYRLSTLRTLIVKRPAITTAEVLIGPLRGRRKTHLVTGYVHKPYPRIYALLAREARFDSALIVRGVEGGVIPSLRQAGKAFYYHDGGEEQPFEFSPADFGVEQSLRAPQIPGGLTKGEEAGDDVPENLDTAAVAKFAAEAGLDALRGRPGPTRNGLICSAALCLRCLKRYDSLESAANAVREVLDSGKALQRIQRAR